MVDGPTEPGAPTQTETTRAGARAFVEAVLIGRAFDRFEAHVDSALIQHDPGLTDGIAPWREALQGEEAIEIHTLHRVLAEGCFALSVCEGTRGGVHTAFYDLLRFSDGKIAERWNTVEAVAPKSEWKNDNGKF